VRSVASVIVGYLLFGVAAGLLFGLTQREPHHEQPAMFVVLSVIYGVGFAAAGGYLAAKLAPRRPRLHAGLVSVVIATLALASLAVNLGHGAIWSELATVALMAPAAALGGAFTRAGRASV
jgi:hypothetical protein